MNRWEAEVILHHELGWWGYDYHDDPVEMETWDELVDAFVEKYPNKKAAYADGVSHVPAEFWEQHKTSVEEVTR